MTSDNPAPCTVTHYWCGWVTVPGHGRAWASGHVTTPLCTPREQTFRLIAAWLRERGCAVPADISRAISLLPGGGSTDPYAHHTNLGSNSHG